MSEHAAFAPRVSVIIPTHDRRDTLRQTLQALAKQEFPFERMEVVVVCDACSDGTDQMVREFQAPFSLRLVRQRAAGAGASRNAGVAASTGELLLFLDDDVEPTPGLVAAHVRAHGAGRDRVVVGPYPPVAPGRLSLYRIQMREWWERQFHTMRQPGHRFTYRDVVSGNLSLSRELFTRVEGFDPAITGAGGEDWELGVRLLAAGAELTFAPDALAAHHEHSDLARSFARTRQEGRSDVRIGMRHPALRPSLPLGAVHANERADALLRFFAFDVPLLGGMIATLLRHALTLLERARLRQLWRALSGALRRYWYWRGVAERIRSARALRAFVAEGAAARVEEPLLELDLRHGVEEAERALDAQRPAGARLRCGAVEIGVIPALPAAERLRGAHLRPALAAMAPATLIALAADRVLPPVQIADASSPRPAAAVAGDVLRPAKVISVEITQPMRSVQDLTHYRALRVLVRRHGMPVGWVELPGERAMVSATELLQAIVRSYGWYLVPALLDRALPAPARAGAAGGGERGDAVHASAVRHEAGGARITPTDSAVVPRITVAVCTRDRAAMLRRCLQALSTLDYPSYELLVVDNASRDPETREVALQFGARYVREHRPGLDWARARAVREARTPIIAFTDDDTVADAGWLRAIARAFADPSVAAVTGLIAPLEMETHAQWLFETIYGGMTQRLTPWRVQRQTVTRWQMLWASAYGVGANMSFRREVFDAVGTFDPALDVGTPSGGAGDIELLHRIVASGRVLRYEPSAVVWHHHRATMDALRRQLFDNGRSFPIYLMTCARNRTLPVHTIASFALREWMGRWLLRRMVRPRGMPRRMVWAELWGTMLSPVLYVRTRAHARRIAQLPDEEPVVAREPDAAASLAAR
ncbi:MAG TPA: glycosyltransferase [Gemmatimonadaceae bacterium]|nr:glycosyltransferase [Gemmatimonadaceae bacterium]